MHNDEFVGQGGSYILDPETGIRTRVEEPTQGHVRPVVYTPLRGDPSAAPAGGTSAAPASPSPRRSRAALVTNIEEVTK